MNFYACNQQNSSVVQFFNFETKSSVFLFEIEHRHRVINNPTSRRLSVLKQFSKSILPVIFKYIGHYLVPIEVDTCTIQIESKP